MQIDIVSDVMCPWCVIGYKNLEKAIQSMPELNVEIHWRAFELNPNMPVEGQEIQAHLMEKYGITKEQSAANRARIEEMGENAGFRFNFADDALMINSFDCHRLLAWAHEQGRQTELKLALFGAHFTDNQPLNDKDVLLKVVESVGLSTEEAEQILDSDQYSEQVRAEQAEMHQLGIQSVPTFIINQKYAINGGQPADVFKQALEQIQAESTSAA